MSGFDKISEEEIVDAGFLAGLITPGARLQLTPMPVKVDGLTTVAFCVRAEPVGMAGTKILHPVALVPHRKMLIQDLRNGTSAPLSRIRVLPLDVRAAKIQRAALEDPEKFFSFWASEAAAQ
jgi:hypothetical protein